MSEADALWATHQKIVAHLVGAHEANHLGQVGKILDLAGLTLGRDLGMAL